MHFGILYWAIKSKKTPEENPKFNQIKEMYSLIIILPSQLIDEHWDCCEPATFYSGWAAVLDGVFSKDVLDALRASQVKEL